MAHPQMFPYRADALAPAAEELDRWRTRLDHQGPLPRRWEGRLRRDLEAEAVAASTRMGGVNVTVEEVRRILAGERPKGVPAADADLVRGYREAMRFVLRSADDPAFVWDRGLIVGLHDRVMAGRHPIAGRLRTERPVFIVRGSTGETVFLPAPGEQVGALINQVCEQMEQRDAHPALAAAWIHVASAAIHPFADGNGRSARILASLAMYRGGFRRPEFTTLEEWWGRHLDAYYDGFTCLGDSFDPGADVTEFVVGHVEAQLHQVRALDVTLKVQRQLWTAVERLAEDSGLNPRLANAFWEVFFGRDVTAGYYRSVADVSAATATVDLHAGVASGMLGALGQRRGRRYVAGERLFERLGATFSIDAGDPSTAKDRIVYQLTQRVATDG